MLREESQMSTYNRAFYKRYQSGSNRSAQEVVPLILELVKPHSVIDVGCGIGTWLSVFAELGIQDICGVDGKWVDKSLLLIPQNYFLTRDLTQPLRVDRTFDLAMSLEVAEHLPIQYAEGFVESLTRLAPIVVFSAAIPRQGGDHHVNEQFPEYWAGLFKKKKYVVIDPLRKKIWQNPNVESFYSQNILFFVKETVLENYPSLKVALQTTDVNQLAIVHPDQYLVKSDPSNIGVKEALLALPAWIKKKASFFVWFLLGK
jgi:SAM-dependent methyltransferase